MSTTTENIEKIKSLQIRWMNAADIETYLDHLSRHFRELGVGGVICQPHPVEEALNKNSLRHKILQRWAGTPGKGAWEVALGVFDGNQIVGHLEMIGSSMESSRHRCRLGLGIETPYRGFGLGKQLMTTAIDWASSQSFLDWIDLDVFANNFAAIKLYKSFGFEQVGLTKDRFRVNQEQIDDLHFVLAL